MWRKSRTPSLINPRCIGVDQNRNFDVHHAGPININSIQKNLYEKFSKKCFFTLLKQRQVQVNIHVLRHMQGLGHFRKSKLKLLPILFVHLMTSRFTCLFIPTARCSCFHMCVIKIRIFVAAMFLEFFFYFMKI